MFSYLLYWVVKSSVQANVLMHKFHFILDDSDIFYYFIMIYDSLPI